MKSSQKQSGFTLIETLLVLIVLLLVGFIGFSVYSASQNRDTVANSKAAATEDKKATKKTTEKLNKTYTNTYGHYSIKYPASWKLADTTESPDREQSATLTSAKGTVLKLRADEGGKGGACEPSEGDVVYRPGNTCPTLEYLSLDTVPVDNLYYPMSVTRADGSIDFEYTKGGLAAVTTKYGDTEGKLTYNVAATSTRSNEPIELNSPKMAAFSSGTFVNVNDKTGKFYPYIYVQASGNSESFLRSVDVKTIKEIIKTIKLDI